MKNLRKPLSFIVLYFFFWLFISWLDRFFFLVFTSPKSLKIGFWDVIDIYWNGLILDVSMAAYICAVPFLVFIVWSCIPQWKLSNIWIKIYTFTVLLVVAILSSINANLYPEWTDKVSKRAIDAFLETPAEAIGCADPSALYVTPTIILVIFVGGIVLFTYLFKHAFSKSRLNYGGQFLFLMTGAFFLFSCIRGGYGTSPLNESMAYYSTKQYFNHAAVNTYWSFISDYINSGSTENIYPFYDNDAEIERQLAPVFEMNPDSAYKVIDTNRPNVVLIILESFIADLVGNLGGEKGITPNLDKISDQGILFTNLYSAADRSDKGMVGIFSAFPAQGKESIIKVINKHEHLPAMGQEIKAAGYNTSFYYGGQSEFYNFKSFMMSHGIDRVIDMHDFDRNDNESSWGVYDEKVFDLMLHNLNKEKAPFFSTIFTITNHEPFDLKTAYKYGNTSTANKFKSTAYYTDSVVNDFLEKAKKQPWYKNTLFVITADHGHRMPKDRDVTDPLRFHVPLILYGDVLKKEFRGKRMERIGSQVDIAATLLGQLDLDTKNYPWSRNQFNSTAPAYAFFNTKHSIGVVSDHGTVVFDGQSKSIIEANGMKDGLLDMLKAYNQKVFDQYLHY